MDHARAAAVLKSKRANRTTEIDNQVAALPRWLVLWVAEVFRGIHRKVNLRVCIVVANSLGAVRCTPQGEGAVVPGSVFRTKDE
jgi:hypothetical protein